jgi:hypothetical protein
MTAEANPNDNNFTGPLSVAYIQKKLATISEFVSTCTAGIETSNSDFENDVYALLKIKENIGRINNENKTTLLDLEIIEQMLANFEKQKSSRVKDYENTKKLINDLHSLEKKCFETDKQIQPNIKSEASKRKEEIKNFEDELKVYLLG